MNLLDLFEFDVNLLKAAQKYAKEHPQAKDFESERNIHKKYGYRTDQDETSEDDYDQWGNYIGKKKLQHLIPGEKRRPGRPAGSKHATGAKGPTGKSKLLNKDAIHETLPSHIKPSDLPPGMRSRLTMKDIEAERPQGAYRYRVGKKEFMDLDAARQFAAGTGQTVHPIREDQKKSSSPRIEKILKQLRIQYPQAKDDLEALVFSMQSGQRQDRQDINRLDAENDSEEADIADIEQMIQSIKDRRADLAEKRDRTPGKISKSEDPCWSGYHMVGTKKKGGRTVPNCVPGAKGAANEAADSSYTVSVQRSGPNEMPV